MLRENKVSHVTRSLTNTRGTERSDLAELFASDVEDALRGQVAELAPMFASDERGGRAWLERRLDDLPLELDQEVWPLGSFTIHYCVRYFLAGTIVAKLNAELDTALRS
ncbi:hypothetical protein BN2475_120092 [Paraburkholderia ribeironis]|uniref:Uncharacterized protein n=2 Tax=Paraburkholderia ribeironis TaxID=1247936 RepID=A0A1N7RR61_9BURK|nr:hypothetical protein BN2475_120092 [Paraburkholderia ribeironis]